MRKDTEYSNNTVRKVECENIGNGRTTADEIAWLKENLRYAPQHRWDRVARLIIAFEKGIEYSSREMNYAVETGKLVEKCMDNLPNKSAHC